MFEKAGYILYPECETEADIQAFRHYYNRLRHGPTPIYHEGKIPVRYAGEELCTFNGGRLHSCRVWFAVKKEVAKNKLAIKRAREPQRQDEYGTSVLSIQWSRLSSSTLFIQNRYNHFDLDPDGTVSNSTFSNNLDNIYPGLQAAFCYAFGIESKKNTISLQIDQFVLGEDGKHYLLNNEINCFGFCDNNVIVFPNSKVEQYATERYIVMDGYIIDLQDKKLLTLTYNLDFDKYSNFDIDKISITKVNDERKLSFILKDGTELNLTLDQRNIVRKMDSPNMVNMPNNFLDCLKNLTEISFESLETMGNFCFPKSNALTSLYLPSITSMGYFCFSEARSLNSLSLPNNTRMGDNCFDNVRSLTSLYLPNNITMGYGCFENSPIYEMIRNGERVINYDEIEEETDNLTTRLTPPDDGEDEGRTE